MHHPVLTIPPAPPANPLSGGCIYHDYTERSLYLGQRWPFNSFGLTNDYLGSIFELDAGVVINDEAEKDLEGETPPVPLDEPSLDSACTRVSLPQRAVWFTKIR